METSWLEWFICWFKLRKCLPINWLVSSLSQKKILFSSNMRSFWFQLSHYMQPQGLWWQFGIDQSHSYFLRSLLLSFLPFFLLFCFLFRNLDKTLVAIWYCCQIKFRNHILFHLTKVSSGYVKSVYWQ